MLRAPSGAKDVQQIFLFGFRITNTYKGYHLERNFNDNVQFFKYDDMEVLFGLLIYIT